MPAGRPRKSEALRQAQGLRSHKRKKPATPAAAPAAAIDTPPMVALEPPARVPAPEWLSTGARKLWGDLAQPLMRRGLLQDADATAFGRYLEWLREYLAMQAARKRGKVVTTTNSRYAKKMQRIDKHFQALMLIDKRLSDFEDRFGMNPRERLAIMAKLAAGAHHPPPAPPPARAADTGEPGSGPVVGPSLPSSPVGFLSSRTH